MRDKRKLKKDGSVGWLLVLIITSICLTFCDLGDNYQENDVGSGDLSGEGLEESETISSEGSEFEAPEDSSPDSDDSLLLCNSDPSNYFPPPYNECSGNPFCWECSEDDCFSPDSESTRFYFDLWKSELMSRLKITIETFDQHFFINKVKLNEDPSSAGFRVDYLIYSEWVTVRDNFGVFFGEKLSPDRDEFLSLADREISRKVSLYGIEPDFDVAMKGPNDVMTIASECYPDMEPDFCHNSYRSGSFIVETWGAVNYDENKCKYADIDISKNELRSCFDDVCYYD